MPGKHHRRRHSYDFSQVSSDEEKRCYEQSRKVHFDDQYLTRLRKGYVIDKRKGNNDNNDIRQMNIDETTVKLKESYQNIDKGLHILRRIYDNLVESKQSIRYQNDCSQKLFISEINMLLEQVDALEKSLRKSGDQKREYIDELSRLQHDLHEDRLKIEAARESRHDLHEKMNESTKVTREQQITINKLKRDNQNLWKILQDVKKHLLEEDQPKEDKLLCRRLPEPKCTPSHERFRVECDLFPLRDNESVTSKESHSTNFSGSTADAMLTEKLNYLAKRSENIQNMIEKARVSSGNNKGVGSSSRMNRSFSDDCLASKSKLDPLSSPKKSFYEKKTARSQEKRIPSENEFGVRSDAKDIMRRCEELERRVEQCSTKDMRDRLMRQLDEMEHEEGKNLSVRLDEKEDRSKKTGKIKYNCFKIISSNNSNALLGSNLFQTSFNPF